MARPFDKTSFVHEHTTVIQVIYIRTATQPAITSGSGALLVAGTLARRLEAAAAAAIQAGNDWKEP